MGSEWTPSPNQILALVGPGAAHDAMKGSDLTIAFCTSTSEAFQKIPELHPAILLHDATTTESSQTAAFHQRLSRLEEYDSLYRILIVKELKPQAIALSIDCGIQRVVSQAAASIDIVEVLRMALRAEHNLSAIQRKVRAMRANPAKYDQSEIDAAVQEAYAQFAHDPAVKLEFANLCARREDWAQARAMAEALLKTEPAHVRAMNLLARILMKTGQFEEGIHLLEGANTLSPKNPERLAALGTAFLHVGKKESAKQCFLEALEADPSNGEATQGLGEICLEDGDAQGIIEFFSNTLSEEEIVGFFNNAAINTARSGRVEAALRLYDMALAASLSPHLRCVVHFNIGLAYRRMGEPEEAVRIFRKCLKLDSSFKKAIRNMEELEHGGQPRK